MALVQWCSVFSYIVFFVLGPFVMFCHEFNDTRP